jgi:hypothetical protein
MRASAHLVSCPKNYVEGEKLTLEVILFGIFRSPFIQFSQLHRGCKRMSLLKRIIGASFVVLVLSSCKH